MKILAFAASSSKRSINAQLIGYATRLIEEGIVGDATASTLDLNDFEMPIYSVDRQDELGILQPAHDFFNLIGEADAVVISFAEHNGSYTVAYKNVFDWASRIDARVYQEKPVVLMATSPGRRGGSGVLAAALSAGSHFGQEIRASLSIPSFYDNFDSDLGVISDEALDAEFRAALETLGTSHASDDDSGT